MQVCSESEERRLEGREREDEGVRRGEEERVESWEGEEKERMGSCFLYIGLLEMTQLTRKLPIALRLILRGSPGPTA